MPPEARYPPLTQSLSRRGAANLLVVSGSCSVTFNSYPFRNAPEGAFMSTTTRQLFMNQFKAVICTTFISRLVLSAFAQGAAFTHKKRLNDASGPANALFDS